MNNQAIKVCAGDGFSVVLNQNGLVYSCGKGNFGRLGQGHAENINKMTKISGFNKFKVKIKDIEVGGRHCLAISEENKEIN